MIYKKGFYDGIFKILFRTCSLVKRWKLSHILVLFSILRITIGHFSKNLLKQYLTTLANKGVLARDFIWVNIKIRYLHTRLILSLQIHTQFYIRSCSSRLSWNSFQKPLHRRKFHHACTHQHLQKLELSLNLNGNRLTGKRETSKPLNVIFEDTGIKAYYTKKHNNGVTNVKRFHKQS